MKTSLPLFVCLATLPFLAPAQTAPVNVSAPEAPSGSEVTNHVFEPLPTPSLTLQAPEPSFTSNSLSDYTTRAAPKREVLIENRIPQATIGGGYIPISGWLVDVFRVGSDWKDKPSLLERVLGRRSSVAYAEQHEQKMKWRDDYLKWGERNEPWSVASAPPPLQPVSVLFQTHH